MTRKREKNTIKGKRSAKRTREKEIEWRIETEKEKVNIHHEIFEKRNSHVRETY